MRIAISIFAFSWAVTAELLQALALCLQLISSSIVNLARSDNIPVYVVALNSSYSLHQPLSF